MAKNFTSAILFDMENLLKGYRLDAQALGKLSLKEIVQIIKEREEVSDLAVQRAYAHWANRSLEILRREIMELGIDPVQIFGFSFEARKDAADLQLAIDAIDLAYTRPSIKTYVIVSGDGGFSALAKKLHELGKTVIGASYRDLASHTLRAVCDDFVFLNDPEKDDLSTGSPDLLSEAGDTSVGSGVIYDAAHVHQFVEKMGHEDGGNKSEVLLAVRRILEGIKHDTPLKADTIDGGLELSLLADVFRQVILGFTPTLFGFLKLYEFLQFACAKTPFAVGRDSQTTSGKVMLVLRDVVPPGFVVLPDIDERPLHTLENYMDVLRYGTPYFRLPRRRTMRTIAQWLEQQDSDPRTLGDWLDQLHDELGQNANEISMHDARLALLSLAIAGVFERIPPQGPIADQKLLLKRQEGPGWISRTLADALRTKLLTVLPEVHEDVLGQVIP